MAKRGYETGIAAGVDHKRVKHQPPVCSTLQYLTILPSIRTCLIKYFTAHPSEPLDRGHVTLALLLCRRDEQNRQSTVRDVLRQIPDIQRFREWTQGVPTILEDITLSRTVVKTCQRLYNRTDTIQEVVDFSDFLFATDLKLVPSNPAASLFLSPATAMLSVPMALRVWDRLDRPELTTKELFRVGFFYHVCTKWSVDLTTCTVDYYGRSRVAWALDVVGVLRNTFQRCRNIPYNQLYRQLLQWMSTNRDTLGLGVAITHRGTLFVLTCWEQVQSEIITLLKGYLGTSVHQQRPETSDTECSICIETVDVSEGVALPCRHAFHRVCIETWSAVNSTCPLCRARFTLDTHLPTRWAEWPKPDRLNADQLRAAENCVRSKFSIVTGAGGTGKTEVAAVVGQYLTWLMIEEFQYPSVCVAPSGKATEVLKARLGDVQDTFTISTIHRWILKTAKTACVPFLFVDEASMVDLWTTWHLLQAARNAGVCHIVLFGDPQQLAPVDNRGTLLDAFLSTGGPNTVVTSLTTNYRATTGLLSLMENLRQVAMGTTNVVQKEWFTTTNSTLVTVPNDDHERLYTEILSQLRGNDPSKTRIIVGRKAPIIQRGTPTSTRAAFLLSIHAFFNPTPATRTTLDYHVGDLVRSAVNITQELPSGGVQLMVANGSEGIVTDISPLVVSFHGQRFDQSAENSTSVQKMFETLEWGHISTVHKFQGSEAHTIVAIFLGDYMDHNTIQLLYTAASRAREKLIVIMEERNLALFCKGPGRVFRNALFNTDVDLMLASR